MTMDRRTFTLVAVGAALLLPVRVEAGPIMTVHKDPTCGCCKAWVDHVRSAGYEARVIEVPSINAVKAKFGVPAGLRSCHTAEIEGYVLEGHVPATAIKRLLAERPNIRGLAVPGMPIGSLGMEVEGRNPETYEVMLFGEAGSRQSMTFRGNEAI